MTTTMPRTGRPPEEGETRSERVVFRALPAQVAAWRDAAEAEGVELSAWLRDLADAAALKTQTKTQAQRGPRK